MKPEQKLSPDALDEFPGSDAQNASIEQPAASVPDALATDVAKPALTKNAVLLDAFYYWALSRSG